MKTLLFLTTALLSISVSASEIQVLKSCTTTLAMPGESQKIETSIVVNSEMGALSATITQKDGAGNVGSYTEIVTIEDEKVKAGLSGNLDDTEKLNMAESLINHAIAITEDPIMEGILSAGLDLRKVRSAKVYLIGKATHMGGVAIVEARDEKDQNLGSFFGGFLVSPCK